MCVRWQVVNHVYFSPDGRWVASASFDKSVKVWDGVSGKFVANLRGHVGPVYQIRWEGGRGMGHVSKRCGWIRGWMIGSHVYN